ncbi:MAG: hypothetical protein JWQ14_661 [Adhaeribacter sp.]|jgi:uncharacterized protein YbjT (DUF2867 family)|nr:hypothetical protein [Adhaeribacter sp.]
MNKKRKVIIIGASGDLAGHVIEALGKVNDVHQTLFLRKKSRLRNQNLSNAAVVEGDVLDYPML